jgi:hypothetical protein
MIKDAVREALSENKGTAVPMETDLPPAQVSTDQTKAEETKGGAAPMDVDQSTGKTSVCDPAVQPTPKTPADAAMASQDTAPAQTSSDPAAAAQPDAAPAQQQQQQAPPAQQQAQQQVPRPDGALLREHVKATDWASPFFPAGQAPPAAETQAQAPPAKPAVAETQSTTQESSGPPKPSNDSIICDTAKALLEQHKDTPAFNTLMALLDSKDVTTAARIIQDLASRPAKASRTAAPETVQEVGVAAGAQRRPAQPAQPAQQQQYVQLGYSSGRGPAPMPGAAPQAADEGFIVVASDMNPRADAISKIRASGGSVFMQQPSFKNAHYNMYAENNWMRQQRRMAQAVGEGLSFARSSGATAGFIASARDPNATRCAKAGTSFVMPCLSDDSKLPSDIFECVAKTVEYVARTCAAGASAWEIQVGPTAGSAVNEFNKRSRGPM